MSDIYLLLGSNLGNREENLRIACEELSSRLLRETKGSIVASSVYESEPWGFNDTNLFLNQALFFSSDIDPEALLIICKQIERDMGREEVLEYNSKGERIYHSRVIDIDILLMGDLILNEPHLQIPHIRLHERKFALEPLCELAPRFIHPVLGKTIRELLTDISSK